MQSSKILTADTQNHENDAGMKPASWRVLKVGSLLAPVLVIMFLWVPAILHFHVPHISVTDAMIRSARGEPSDEVLAELGKIRFFVDAPRDKVELIAKAENLLHGTLDAKTKITMPFAPKDLDEGGFQLFIAGFGVPRILLSAYAVSGKEIFFNAAKNVILTWAKYENKTWLPRGLLWNDHAVAERMLVLAEFWRLYRHHSGFRSDEARTILELATRTSWLLAAPSHFRFSTNHGIMQNLALWHFSLAFPTLPNAKAYQRLALKRMRDQMSFYIDDEGVVLEHSPAYHVFGLELLGYAMRYLTLSNLPVPSDWVVKYKEAQTFYANLRLPNGSLPVFGDTGTGNNVAGPLITNVDSQGRAGPLTPEKNWRPKNAFGLYPIAGYAVWWNGLETWPKDQNLAQVVVAWSNFRGHAHKHADEMSLSLWASGQRWLTNLGFRRPDSEARSEVLSWNGSNAPHLVSEDRESPRRTKLNYFGWSDQLAFLDLERSGPGSYIARRQILWRKPNLWIVVDQIRGQQSLRSRTIWRFGQRVMLRKGYFPKSFQLRAKSTEAVLTGLFITSAGSALRADVADKNNGRVGQPFIAVEQPGGASCSAAIWSLTRVHNASTAFPDGHRLIQCDRFDQWKLSFPSTFGEMTIQRVGQVVHFLVNRNGSRENESFTLEKANDISENSRQIRDGYRRTAAKYPFISNPVGNRIEASKLLVIFLSIQEVFLLLCRRNYPRAYRSFRTLSALVWLAGGVLLYSQFDRLVEIYSNLRLPI